MSLRSTNSTTWPFRTTIWRMTACTSTFCSPSRQLITWGPNTSVTQQSRACWTTYQTPLLQSSCPSIWLDSSVSSIRENLLIYKSHKWLRLTSIGRWSSIQWSSLVTLVLWSVLWWHKLNHCPTTSLACTRCQANRTTKISLSSHPNHLSSLTQPLTSSDGLCPQRHSKGPRKQSLLCKNVCLTTRCPCWLRSTLKISFASMWTWLFSSKLKRSKQLWPHNWTVFRS